MKSKCILHGSKVTGDRKIYTVPIPKMMNRNNSLNLFLPMDEENRITLMLRTFNATGIAIYYKALEENI